MAMEWRRIACAAGCAITIMGIALIIVSSLFASSARNNTIKSSGPVTIDEHDEKSVVRFDGSSTALIVLTILVVVIIIAITVTASCCYHRQIYLPRRRVAREQQRVTQDRLRSANDQVANIFHHFNPSNPGPSVRPSMPLAPMHARSPSLPVPATAGSKDYFR
jgi:hypothetical protein